MSYSRRLLLDSAINTRELGGFSTQNGKVTKQGVFLRSDALCNLTERDMNFLKNYGIKTVVDLRSEPETKNLRSSFLDDNDIAYRNIPVSDAFYHAMNKIGEGDQNVNVQDLYIEIMEMNKEQFAKIFKTLSGSNGLTAFHCTAGKDRTGLVSAVLLSVAGVPRLDIVADYQVTATYLIPRFEKIFNNPKYENVPKHFFDTVPEYMLSLLSYIDRTYGGMEAYLLASGVAESDIEKFIQKFV